MALLRAAALCRLALRTPWTAARLLGSAAAGGEPSAVEDTPRVADLEASAAAGERALRPPSERTPPEVAFRTPKPTHKQILLNNALTECTSVDEILDLVSARDAPLNCVIVPTALMRLTRVVGKREPALWLKDDKRFRQLMRTAQKMLQDNDMDTRSYSNMLYACGQLRIAPPPSWLAAFWEASGDALRDHFKPQHFSNTLYACGQLGVTPPEFWLLRFWQGSAACFIDFVPQALSNTLYACGQLGLVPPADWLERYWHASAVKLGEFNPQDCSNTIYACGQLGITPPDYWLERFWHASALKLGEYNPQAFANTLYASGQLGITPPDDWLPRYWHFTAPKLGGFNPQELSNTMHTCALLGIVPPADWLLQFWEASAAKLNLYLPQALSNTLLACAQLNAMPPASWLQQFSGACEALFESMNHQDLANTVLALATLGLWELPLCPGLWERLCLALSSDIAGWSANRKRQAQQLYQAYQIAAAERPGLLSAPSAELLAAARESWIDGLVTDSIKTSLLHASVSDCLKTMGIEHDNEHWCDRVERSIDIAIETGASRIALEVDGPHHFLQDGSRTGSTLLRDRALAAHGWRVVVVHYREWRLLEAQPQREEYLRRLLA